MTDFTTKESLGAKPLLYPTPVLVVGTYDTKGKPNLMTAAWGGLCCSSPPSIAVSLRKATYTYGNIQHSECFTINIPSTGQAEAADFVGMVSGDGVDKFHVAGLTPVASTVVNAPYIDEFPMVLECKLSHTVEIGLHTQFIGEILDIKVAASCLNAKNKPAMDKVQPIVFAPELREYFAVGESLGAAFSMGKSLAQKARQE